MLIGKDAVKRLARANVAVFGIGGVGSFAVEALVRAGVGKLVLVDSDVVAPSNLNRQLIALNSCMGQKKAEVAKRRALDINPDVNIQVIDMFFLPETAGEFDFAAFDYVVDAVDTLAAKLELARLCSEAGTPIISCMGMGNKLDPTQIEVADIFETSVCPLARAMRQGLKRLGIKKLKTVYSKEQPVRPAPRDENDIAGTRKRQTPASISFVPSVAGLIMAGEVIKDLIKA